MSNPVTEVQKFGQSIWYDNIRRGLITSGDLARMVESDGLLGVTSNPAIFEKALVGSVDYDPATKALVGQGVGNAQEIYETLAIEDIRLAADVLFPVYKRTEGRDGYVSFEVSPHLAHDTKGTIEEARRLHKTIGRDNVMIKIPGTVEGLPAITQAIGDGINVNVTLLFSVEAYEKVAEAYIAGIEQLVAKGGDPSKVASVASFFVSRIDSLVDEKLSQALDKTTDEAQRTKLKGLVGKVAIANAKVAYARSKEIYASDRWKALAAKGARPQRLLWASTSTKNPKYPKTIYVDELIGPDTVNTVPAETFVQFKQGGTAAATLEKDLEGARRTMADLESAGISMKAVTDQLLKEAVQKFCEPFDKLLAAVETKRQELLGVSLDRQTAALGPISEAVGATMADWRSNGKVRRLWAGDTSLWTGDGEDQWLGWLHVVDGQADHPEHLLQIAKDARDSGFTHVLLLGMGGSSLCPDVLRATFGKVDGAPELVVLDSTVPAQVKACENKVDLAKTLFIVSSKSGSTTEPNVFKQYFFEKVRGLPGVSEPGERFLAITDPGTKMHKIAKADHFRTIAHGVPSIGGRYSAMSNFGMVPAAAMGLDVLSFLDRTEVMVQSCDACVPADLNPGVQLGTILGTSAKNGRDKMTLIVSPAIRTLGAWLEQLLAESTGKLGTGVVPIDGEQVGPPEVYGQDRLFAYIRLNGKTDPKQEKAIDALEKAGHPVVRITLDNPMDLGQEFFRWEIATAVAGSVLGINAFDQPDVEASKVATRKLSAAYEETGKMPDEQPVVEDGGIKLFTDPKNAQALAGAASSRSVEAFLAAHLARIKAGDYCAINAYVEMNDANGAILEQIRHAIRDKKKVATTLGFGPRFLHSTGQLHKGGPNSGVFLQVTSDDANDLPIPGQKYSFGQLKAFQAQGDFEVLAERDRRALRVHLGPDVPAALRTLQGLIAKALG